MKFVCEACDREVDYDPAITLEAPSCSCRAAQTLGTHARSHASANILLHSLSF